MRLKSITHDDAPITANVNQRSTTAREPDGYGQKPLYDALKRIMDLLIAVPMAIIALPGFALLGLLVWLDDRGPVFFAHTRRRQDGKSFKCLKFRTMVENAEDRLQAVLAVDPELRAEWNASHKLKRDPRITRIGKFLRGTSLDELPQLLNIIRGEMSIVGPRPIGLDEVYRYGDSISAYDAVPPGIVGLWQISGRSDTGYTERIALDIDYAARRSLGLDIMILLRSIPVILSRKGAY